MQAVILAGGKGTRLGRSDIPKPLVRIGEQTLLEHQIAWLRRHGLDEIYVLTGHLAPAIFDHVRDGSGHGVRLTHAIEPYPLGTAGSVAMLKHLLRDRFLVVYGDVLLDMDLDRLLGFDRQNESLGTLVVHPNAHPYDSDLLETDEQDTIAAFHPKPRPAGAWYHNLVNAGVYVLRPEVVADVPFGQALDFGRDILPALVRAGGRLRAYRTTEYIQDVGTPDRLRRVTQDYLHGKVARLNRRHRRRAVFLDRDGVLVKYVDHLSRAEDLELLEGAAEAVAGLNGSEYLAVLVTNQPMIAKGFLTTAELRALHKKMETALGLEQAYLDALYYCPHHPARGSAGTQGSLPLSQTATRYAAAGRGGMEHRPLLFVDDRRSGIGRAGREARRLSDDPNQLARASQPLGRPHGRQLARSGAKHSGRGRSLQRP
jgi:mannose-1-phosphate guanylyltransferase / phosphomannomutase